MVDGVQNTKMKTKGRLRIFIVELEEAGLRCGHAPETLLDSFKSGWSVSAVR